MAEQPTAILGANGMLGTDLSEACRRNKLDAAGFDLPKFDITDPDSLETTVRRFDAVVNCAAYTDVDGAETHRQTAHKVNAEAVGHLGAAAKRNGTWVLHVSTDFVFDGDSPRPYRETDTPNPVNAYGQSKLDGENLLIESECRHCIIRLEWTYGRAGRNFVTKIVKRAGKGGRLKVVDDQIGSPTATAVAAEVICVLLRKRPEGIFHFASDGCASRFEVARFILDKLKLEAELTPCKSGEFAAVAKRPLNSSFDTAKIKKLLDEPVEHWKGPMERFLEEGTRAQRHKAGVI
jgi:dTDP-4-dehydrorhamnose reductase